MPPFVHLVLAASFALSACKPRREQSQTLGTESGDSKNSDETVATGPLSDRCVTGKCAADDIDADLVVLNKTQDGLFSVVAGLDDSDSLVGGALAGGLSPSDDAPSGGVMALSEDSNVVGLNS